MESHLEGQQIGRYLVRQRIGGGGVATVYQADDQVSGQAVALKVLPPNPDAATLNRFRREALQAGGLHHPNIVRILQVGTAADGESAYIAMDLVEGESLASLLNRLGQLPAEESCRLLEPVARALAYAHSQGVIHRDVKPSNILLRSLKALPKTPADEKGIQLREMPFPVVPLLSDFGIARYLDMDGADLTFIGQTVGTPAFMAPEQCMGSRELDGRADIYALGVVLYRCVVGHLPFSGSTTQILHAHVFEPVVLDDLTVRSLPAKVIDMLRHALAKAPEDRYQNAQQFAGELAEVGYSSLANQPLSVNENGATVTLAQLPAAKQPTPTGVKILVPGATTVTLAAQNLPARVPKKRRREPFLVTMLWTLLFIALAAALFWNVRAWYNRQDEPQGSVNLVPLHLVTFTPTPLVVTTPTATSAPAFVVIPATATSIPTATPLPPATDTPMPTLVPTETPVVEEVATPTSPPTEEVAQPTTGSQEVAVACNAIVDEFFSPKLQALSSDQKAEFACPTQDAKSVKAEWLPFEHGAIVAIEGDPLVYVYYDNGAWEKVTANEAGDGPFPTVEGRKKSALPRRFAGILAAQGRAILLGEATGAPARAETLVQPFNDGVILGNKDSGQILLLARSKLHF